VPGYAPACQNLFEISPSRSVLSDCGGTYAPGCAHNPSVPKRQSAPHLPNPGQTEDHFISANVHKLSVSRHAAQLMRARCDQFVKPQFARLLIQNPDPPQFPRIASISGKSAIQPRTVYHLQTVRNPSSPCILSNITHSPRNAQSHVPATASRIRRFLTSPSPAISRTQPHVHLVEQSSTTSISSDLAAS